MKLDAPVNSVNDRDEPTTTSENDESARSSIVQTSEERPYSAFTSSEKWTVVVLVSLASFFSPLTANIYFPAIPTIADAFNKSIELINLTVTVYMLFQGVAPMFWGTLADYKGRRPMFLGCLFTLAISCVGLALVPTNAYWLLMLLRCLQAAGSASTVALCAGTVGDIATPAERGGFMGFSGIGTLLGPAIGPVIGGVIAEHLGWRWIFWFLCIITSTTLLFLFLVLPETLRAMVGDGSIPPPRLYRPPLPIIGRHTTVSSMPRPPRKAFQNPFVLFTYPDVITILVLNGVIYAVFYGVTASLSSLFKTDYPFLSETDIGLCFLSVGSGMVVGSSITGKLLDRDYRITRANVISTATSDQDREERLSEFGFPIEKARLRSMPFYLIIYTAVIAGYGWCLQQRVHISAPLILQFIIGYTSVAFFNTTQTLLVDLLPGRGSSVTAANNLVRCSLGAAMVSVIDIIVRSVGQGWTFVILAALNIVVSPLMLLELRMGPKWRLQRRRRELEEEQKKAEGQRTTEKV